MKEVLEEDLGQIGRKVIYIKKYYHRRKKVKKFSQRKGNKGLFFFNNYAVLGNSGHLRMTIKGNRSREPGKDDLLNCLDGRTILNLNRTGFYLQTTYISIWCIKKTNLPRFHWTLKVSVSLDDLSVSFIGRFKMRIHKTI